MGLTSDSGKSVCSLHVLVLKLHGEITEAEEKEGCCCRECKASETEVFYKKLYNLILC